MTFVSGRLVLTFAVRRRLIKQSVCARLKMFLLTPETPRQRGSQDIHVDEPCSHFTWNLKYKILKCAMHQFFGYCCTCHGKPFHSEERWGGITCFKIRQNSQQVLPNILSWTKILWIVTWPHIYVQESLMYCIVIIHFYSASHIISQSEALPTTAIDTVSEFTRRNATGNCKWRTCPRFLRGG